MPRSKQNNTKISPAISFCKHCSTYSKHYVICPKCGHIKLISMLFFLLVSFGSFTFAIYGRGDHFSTVPAFVVAIWTFLLILMDIPYFFGSKMISNAIQEKNKIKAFKIGFIIKYIRYDIVGGVGFGALVTYDTYFIENLDKKPFEIIILFILSALFFGVGFGVIFWMITGRSDLKKLIHLAEHDSDK